MPVQGLACDEHPQQQRWSPTYYCTSINHCHAAWCELLLQCCVGVLLSLSVQIILLLTDIVALEKGGLCWDLFWGAQTDQTGLETKRQVSHKQDKSMRTG